MKKVLKFLKVYLKSFFKIYSYFIFGALGLLILSIFFYPAFSWNLDYSWVKDLFKIENLKVISGILIIISLVISIGNTLVKMDYI